MIRVNSMRLQNIVNNYIEILSELEEDSSLYEVLNKLKFGISLIS